MLRGYVGTTGGMALAALLLSTATIGFTVVREIAARRAPHRPDPADVESRMTEASQHLARETARARLAAAGYKT